MLQHIGRPELDGDVHLRSYVGDGAPALVASRCRPDTDDEGAVPKLRWEYFSWLLPHPPSSTTTTVLIAGVPETLASIG